MDTQGADAHSTVTEPTNCLQRWRKCNKYCRYTPSIVSRAKSDDLHIREKYAHTSFKIFWKVVGCSAGPYTLLFYISYLSRRLMHPCGLLGYLV